MSLGHPPLGRLEADALTEDEELHLASCAQCRIDRRELRGGTKETRELPELDLARVALERARQTGSESLVASWRTVRSESDVARGAPSTEDVLPAGTTVGRYVVDGLLGRGGMAAVYRVSHADLGTQHALKVLSAPGASLRERLLREGRLQAQLRHPNLVGVTDVVEVDGSPALVLEYIAGPTLYEVLRESPLSLDEADAIGIDVLNGVAAAHAVGFVHRDLKPSNILLAPHERGAVAKVADFGLAKALAAQPMGALQTRTGGVLGTLLYMAPEQLRDPRLADARSDVFALGALLYELVTGQRCFAGVDVVDIMQRVSTASRPPLPDDLPPRMVRAIDEALHLDPEARPADAGALLQLWTRGRESTPSPWSLERLDDLREYHTITELPEAPPSGTVATDGSLRRVAWVSASSLALLGVAGLGAWWVWGGAPASQAAIALVHEVPGAPGHAGGTRLTAVFGADLAGLLDPSCLEHGGACSTTLPEPGQWVPLGAAPARTSLSSDVQEVGLHGLVAQADEGVYTAVGDGWSAGAEVSLTIDGASTPIPVRLPDLPALDQESSRPVQVGPDGAPTLTWTPGGAGTPYLEVRPRGGGRGRLHGLEDTGRFTVPLDALPPAPSQTDLVFGRLSTASLTVSGKATTVITRTAQWLTLVRVDPDRAELTGVGNCEETKTRDRLVPGRYWGLFYVDTAQRAEDEVWSCLPRQAAGSVYWYPVVVPAGARRGIRATQLGGDLMLSTAENPSCHRSDCLLGADRPGRSEVVILDGLPDQDRTYNLGVWDGDGVGGAFLIDVVDLGTPEQMLPSVTWQDELLHLTVERPADVELRFGMAETESGNGWFGEDCLRGDPDRGVAVCHPVVGDSLSLERVPTPDRVVAGRSTLWWPDIGVDATYYLETPNIPRDDGQPWCLVWGADPTYYAERGCQQP